MVSPEDIVGFLSSLFGGCQASRSSSPPMRAREGPCSFLLEDLDLEASLPSVDCCICLERRPLGVALLPCLHDQFCADCIDRWRRRADTCPLCRRDVRGTETRLRELVPPSEPR